MSAIVVYCAVLLLALAHIIDMHRAANRASARYLDELRAAEKRRLDEAFRRIDAEVGREAAIFACECVLTYFEDSHVELPRLIDGTLRAALGLASVDRAPLRPEDKPS